jgi:hypothetical protein
MFKSPRAITGCRQLCANSTLEIVAMQRKPTSANPSFLSYRPRDATAAAPQKVEIGMTSPKGQIRTNWRPPVPETIYRKV